MALQGAVVTIVIVAVLILIGALVYGYVRDAITTPMSNLGSTNFNNTVSTIDSNSWSGFELIAVGVIVLAAVAIIGVIFLLGGRPA